MRPKLLDRILSHPAVADVDVEPDDRGTSYFVYLKEDWAWSEQRCFGTETLTEAWKLVRQAKRVS